MTLPENPRIVVVAPQGIGDCLEVTPFLAALKRARPRARIDIVVLRTGPRELFKNVPHLVSETIYLPYWELGAGAFVRALLPLRRRERYDAAFLAYPAARPEYQLIMRWLPARLRVSHRYFERALRNVLFRGTLLVPVQKKHNVLRNLDLLNVFGTKIDAPDHYVVPQSWKAAPEDRYDDMVAIHVGSVTHNGLGHRRWSLDRFAEVAGHFLQRGLRVTAIMGPDERKETLELSDRVPGLSVFEGALTDVARFLSKCTVLLANDNGMAHLAAGVGTPVVTLFGPTDPVSHAPYGPNAFALRPSACPPCFDPKLLNTFCVRNIDYRCLKEELPSDLVIGTLTRTIASRRSRLRAAD